MGNTVTCEWWGDTWIQEGAARYLEYVALERIFPELTRDWRFVYALSSFFAADETNTAKAVYVTRKDGSPIESKREIEEMFSTITYGKVNHLSLRFCSYILQYLFC